MAMAFHSSLAFPHAGKWQLLFFRKKVTKKLPAAPFATKAVLLLWLFVTAKAKAEFKVQLGFCFYALWAIFVQVKFLIVLLKQSFHFVKAGSLFSRTLLFCVNDSNGSFFVFTFVQEGSFFSRTLLFFALRIEATSFFLSFDSAQDDKKKI